MLRMSRQQDFILKVAQSWSICKWKRMSDRNFVWATLSSWSVCQKFLISQKMHDYSTRKGIRPNEKIIRKSWATFRCSRLFTRELSISDGNKVQDPFQPPDYIQPRRHFTWCRFWLLMAVQFAPPPPPPTHSPPPRHPQVPPPPPRLQVTTSHFSPPELPEKHLVN